MNRGVMRRHPTRLSAPCAQGQEGLRPDRQCEMGSPLVTGVTNSLRCASGGAATDRTVGTQANVGRTAIRRNDDQLTCTTTLGSDGSV
jgi:hypothetical protein